MEVLEVLHVPDIPVPGDDFIVIDEDYSVDVSYCCIYYFYLDIFTYECISSSTIYTDSVSKGAAAQSVTINAIFFPYYSLFGNMTKCSVKFR